MQLPRRTRSSKGTMFGGIRSTFSDEKSIDHTELSTAFFSMDTSATDSTASSGSSLFQRFSKVKRTGSLGRCRSTDKSKRIASLWNTHSELPLTQKQARRAQPQLRRPTRRGENRAPTSRSPGRRPPTSQSPGRRSHAASKSPSRPLRRTETDPTRSRSPAVRVNRFHRCVTAPAKYAAETPEADLYKRVAKVQAVEDEYSGMHASQPILGLAPPDEADADANFNASQPILLGQGRRDYSPQEEKPQQKVVPRDIVLPDLHASSPMLGGREERLLGMVIGVPPTKPREIKAALPMVIELPDEPKKKPCVPGIIKKPCVSSCGIPQPPRRVETDDEESDDEETTICDTTTVGDTTTIDGTTVCDTTVADTTVADTTVVETTVVVDEKLHNSVREVANLLRKQTHEMPKLEQSILHFSDDEGDDEDDTEDDTDDDTTQGEELHGSVRQLASRLRQAAKLQVQPPLKSKGMEPPGAGYYHSRRLETAFI